MTEVSLTSHEDYSDCVFDSVNGKDLAIEDSQFENCSFSKCNFGGAAFKRCKFIDCTFEDCDLSNLQIHGATFRSATFKNCKVVGVNWGNATTITHLNFHASVISYAVFSGLDLRKSTIKNSVARETDFAETNLSEVDCSGTDFSGARFSNTNLMKADFRGATNYTIRPDENKLKKAKFSLPEATLLLYGLDIVLEE